LFCSCFLYTSDALILSEYVKHVDFIDFKSVFCFFDLKLNMTPC